MSAIILEFPTGRVISSDEPQVDHQKELFIFFRGRKPEVLQTSG